MADTTPALGLVKPTLAENIDLDVLNGNMDKVDAFSGTISSQVSTFDGKVANLQGILTGTTPWTDVVSPPTSGLGLGTTGNSVLRYKKIGKTAFVECQVNFLGSGAGARTDIFRMSLASIGAHNVARYGALGFCVGTFFLSLTTSVGSTPMIAGNVILGDPADIATYSSPIRFAMAITNNFTTGPYAYALGDTAAPFSYPFSTNKSTLSASFMYELA